MSRIGLATNRSLKAYFALLLAGYTSLIRCRSTAQCHDYVFGLQCSCLRNCKGCSMVSDHVKVPSLRLQALSSTSPMSKTGAVSEDLLRVLHWGAKLLLTRVHSRPDALSMLSYQNATCQLLSRHTGTDR